MINGVGNGNIQTEKVVFSSLHQKIKDAKDKAFFAATCADFGFKKLNREPNWATEISYANGDGKVLMVYDCGDRWIFDFDFEIGTCMSVVFCCFKNTSEFTYFFPPDSPEILKRAKPVELVKMRIIKRS